VYRQEALAHLGHAPGAFPVTDAQALSAITFPCDQHLSKEEMDYVIATVRDFYAR
jgi:dTDP-4-amino-4,6-dideoxygalactose transaminase